MKPHNILLAITLYLLSFSVFAQNSTTQKNDTLIFEGDINEARKHSRDKIAHVIKLTGSLKNKDDLYTAAKDAQAIISTLSKGRVTPTVYIDYTESAGEGIALTSIGAGIRYIDDKGDHVFNIGKLDQKDFTKFLIQYLQERKTKLSKKNSKN
jgi:hypothetical protein